MYKTRVLRIKDILQGGRIVRKRYMVTGAGLEPVVIKRDFMNRRRVERVGRRTRSAPRRMEEQRVVKKEDVMNHIGGALSRMRIGRSAPVKRGRGIAPM